MKNSKLLIIGLSIVIFFLIVQVDYLNNNPKIKTIETVVETEIIVEKEVEVEVIKEKIVEVEPKTFYNVTSEERELIARVLYRESGHSSLDCQKAVVSVIFNRLNSGYWGDTITDVIYAEGQFHVIETIDYTTPTNENYEAVDYVIKNGSTIPNWVMTFNTGGFRLGKDPYEEIDGTYFSGNKPKDN